MLLRHNVRHVFGYPGGAILPVFDAIYDSPHFRFILPRHEQGGGHMAEGYARVTYVTLYIYTLYMYMLYYEYILKHVAVVLVSFW